MKRSVGNERVDGPGRYLIFDEGSAKERIFQGPASGDYRSSFSYSPTLALLRGMRSVYETRDYVLGNWSRYPWRMNNSLGCLSVVSMPLVIKTPYLSSENSIMFPL